MRVAVLVALLECQPVAGLEQLDDGVVGFAFAFALEDLFADELVGHLLFLWQIGGAREAAFVVHRRVNRQAVRAAKVVIVLAVPRRDVHQAGAGAVIDEHVAGEQFAGAVAEWVVILHFSELVALHRAQNLEVTRPAALLDDSVEQGHADEQRLFADADQLVVEPGIVGDGEVGRQCPRRGRPDQQVHVCLAHDREFHINALADMILIFDLRFGQRRAARDAPVYRFFAAINKPLVDQLGEQPQLLSLVLGMERKVRVVPFAEHAEPLELLTLFVNKLQRVRLAGFADHRRCGVGVAALSHLLRDLELDRQPVAVPARHVRHVFAAQRLILENEVLENFVQRCADVHVAVGERRAVMQQKPLGAVAAFLDLLVQAVCVPLGQAFGFALDEPGTHREIRLRKVKRFFILHLGYPPARAGAATYQPAWPKAKAETAGTLGLTALGQAVRFPA